MLHNISPFKNEPVDCVIWVEGETVEANDYNPNSVMPPEMELLHVSVQEDGYTQPIVTMRKDTEKKVTKKIEEDKFEVVDGFHRNRVGKEYPDIKERVHGYLPIVMINEDRKDKGDRMAATIRHNRARGKHSVVKMSDIVSALVKRNWSYEKISKKLGMEHDEVLRLAQVTGLSEIFADKDFSQAWEAETEENENRS